MKNAYILVDDTENPLVLPDFEVIWFFLQILLSKSPREVIANFFFMTTESTVKIK